MDRRGFAYDYRCAMCGREGDRSELCIPRRKGGLFGRIMSRIGRLVPQFGCSANHG